MLTKIAELPTSKILAEISKNTGYLVWFKYPDRLPDRWSNRRYLLLRYQAALVYSLEQRQAQTTKSDAQWSMSKSLTGMHPSLTPKEVFNILRKCKK